MIVIDYSILYSLEMKIQEIEKSALEFLIYPSGSTEHFLERHESLFRLDSGKAFVLASDSIAELEETKEENSSRSKLKVSSLKVPLDSFFLFQLKSKSLVRFIDWKRNTSNLSSLNEFPFLIPIFYIDQGRLANTAPIDKNDIIGLFPSFLQLEKDLDLSITHADTGLVVTPSFEDEQSRQYDFRATKPGLYLLKKPGLEVQKAIIDPSISNDLILGLVHLKIPEGAYTRKDYSIVFKNILKSIS